ncbi:mitochondrial carrier protein [Nitzschia inconspicua]|uniref:Mitochondrial carrier protein n=1 Tax=Nitzschia inconspicua TaxID=303405 RepID=A0A9K3LWE8_9STRA|nr:mitochondrial carrier protein [Nitzschia inconspicua]
MVSKGADTLLSSRPEGTTLIHAQNDNGHATSTPMDRRIFMGTTILGASVAVAAGSQQPAQAAVTNGGASAATYGKLAWESTPINKRTGVTLTDAEKAGYNVRFVTYLARFLLVFDYDCQRWWYSRAADIPPLSSAEQVEAIRLKQFGAFAASVEVGLQDYVGDRGRKNAFGSSGDEKELDGPLELMEALLDRYCPSIEAVREDREQRGLPPLSEQEEARERREIKEARRQIALLFGLLEEVQPVEELNKLLASIDNGSISSVTIVDGGSGYAPGYGPPRVEFPPPTAGEDYKTALGRAILQPNGRILRVDLIDRGFGYSSPPSITISPPGADRGVTIPGAKEASAKAFIFKNGVNKGRLERIQIDDPGTGYNEGEKIRVIISPPELSAKDGGVKATATAVLEYSVAGIDIIDGGNGYAVEKPIPVFVDPPPLTARINLNDPLMARIIDPTKPLPPTTIPSAQQRTKLMSSTNSSDPNSFTYLVSRLASNNGIGGGGGCIGRGCYDQEVVALAKATAETSSFSTFRKETDALRIIQAEEALIKNRVISGASAGSDSQLPAFWNGGPASDSGQLLTLLPPGIGLEYNPDLKRFVLSASSDFIDINQGSTSFSGSSRPLDPEFGPRGRSPVERDLKLDLSSFLRFCASGAVCGSGVHLLVTPLDVIKTKIQTDPENYPGPIAAFQKLVKDQGVTGFFSGWVPTFIGFFCWGGVSYSLTELVRRYLNDQAGVQAGSLEVPIILVSSAVSATVGTFILVPFESVRIRSVAQPGYGKNFLDVTGRIINEEGATSLFSAVPPFLLKEIPFTMAKFVIFNLMTQYLYQTFPAAQEDIQLSLLVSLVSGIMGGAVAAIVSNPADVTISEMKKTKSDMTPIEAAKGLIEKGGYANLMRGLPVRMTFYPLVVSLQFLVYDAVRIYLGIGADDLKVYLDVLGGALKKGESMIGPA